MKTPPKRSESSQLPLFGVQVRPFTDERLQIADAWCGEIETHQSLYECHVPFLVVPELNLKEPCVHLLLQQTCCWKFQPDVGVV